MFCVLDVLGLDVLGLDVLVLDVLGEHGIMYVNVSYQLDIAQFPFIPKLPL